MAIYAARFGYLASWPLDQLLPQLAEQPHELSALRSDFAQVLKVQLPAYWEQKTRIPS